MSANSHVTPLSILCSHGLHANVCQCELLIVLSPIGKVSAVGRGSGLSIASGEKLPVQQNVTSTALSTFVGVLPLQQNVRGVTLGGGLPPGVTQQQSGPGTVLGGGLPPGVTLQQSEPGTALGGGLPPGVTLQQSEPGTILGGGMPPGVTLQQSKPGIVLGGGLPPSTYGGMPPSAALQQSGSVQLGTPSKRTGTYISILIRLHFAM